MKKDLESLFCIKDLSSKYPIPLASLSRELETDSSSPLIGGLGGSGIKYQTSKLLKWLISESCTDP